MVLKTYLQELKENGCVARTLAEIVAANYTVPERSISYSQAKRNQSGFGDCSTLASRVAGIYLNGPGSWGGMSTTTLATYGAFYPIPKDTAAAGDFLMLGGPETDSSGEGTGHVAPIVARNGDMFTVRDHSSGMGPVERKVTWGATRWAKQAWRYAFADVANPPFLGMEYEWKIGNWGGPVRDIQKGINASGVATLVVDGVFGSITSGGVQAFQKLQGLVQDGVVGKETSKALLTFYTSPVPSPEPTPVPPIDYDKLANVLIAKLLAAFKE